MFEMPSYLEITLEAVYSDEEEFCGENGGIKVPRSAFSAWKAAARK